jgi:prepilin-type N-terminal cleavage/methylation domain-containing protein
MRGVRASLSRVAQAESGFTLVELLVAIVVISVGLVATLGVFDSSRRLTTVGNKQDAAVQVGEREVEATLALPYANIGLSGSSLPSASTDPNNPNHYVSGNEYQWDWSNTSRKEHFCAAAAASPYTCPATSPPVDPTAPQGVSAGPEAWTSGGVSGQIYRYVTWVLDNDWTTGGRCPECTGSTDYKRVTIAVTVNGPNAPKKPILLSSIVTSATAGPGSSGS